jgi:formate C-acetyltransferase
VLPKNASIMPVRFVMRSAATRPSPEGTNVAVSEIPSAASVSKIPDRDAQDGISLTTSMVPEGLGRARGEQADNLVGVLDSFFGNTGYHMNVNVLNREMLMDAMEHPEKYPQLTIRVSGYAVNFVRLTREQQMDVINRTFHGAA